MSQRVYPHPALMRVDPNISITFQRAHAARAAGQQPKAADEERLAKTAARAIELGLATAAELGIAPAAPAPQ